MDYSSTGSAHSHARGDPYTGGTDAHARGNPCTGGTDASTGVNC